MNLTLLTSWMLTPSPGAIQNQLPIYINLKLLTLWMLTPCITCYQTLKTQYVRHYGNCMVWFGALIDCMRISYLPLGVWFGVNGFGSGVRVYGLWVRPSNLYRLPQWHNMLPNTQNSTLLALWRLYDLDGCPHRLHGNPIPPSKGFDWG